MPRVKELCSLYIHIYIFVLLGFFLRTVQLNMDNFKQIYLDKTLTSTMSLG